MCANKKDGASFSPPCGFRLECVLHLCIRMCERAVS